MSELQLTLNNDPEIFKELYFKKGTRTVWEFSRKPAIAFFIFVVIAALAFGFAYQENMMGASLILLGFAFVALMLSFFRFMTSIARYRKWRAPIDAYIADVTSYKTCQLILTSQAVELKLDDVSHIEKVDQIVQSSIEQEYISFGDSKNPTKYLIPKKSIRQHEFEQLKSYLKNVLNHGNGS